MKATKIVLAGLSAAVCFLVHQTASANTNEISLDVLLTGQGNFTNATIIRHNPAYAVVDYDGGIIKVADRNLPPDLQKQFGYSPANATKFLNQEMEQHKADLEKAAAMRAAELARIAYLVGTNRIIYINAIESVEPLQCSITTDGINEHILVRNLPDSVREFVNQYNQMRADILALGDKVKDDTSAVRHADAQSSMANDYYAVNGVPAISDTAPAHANLEDEKDNLQQKQDDLKAMADEVPERTAVIAHPSGEFYAGLEIWDCVGLAPQVTGNSNQ